MINSILEIIATVIDVFLLIYFIPKYLYTTFYIKKWTLIFPAVFLTYQLIADHLLEGFNLLNVLVAFIITLLYSFSLSNKRIWRAVLASSIYVIIIMLSGSIVYLGFSFFIDDFDLYIYNYYGTFSFPRIIYLSLGKIVQFILFKTVLIISNTNNGFGVKNGLLSLVFSIATAVGLSALMTVSINNHDKNTNFSILIVVSVLIYVNIALYYLINQVQKLEKSKYELQLISERKEYEKSRSDEASVIWYKIREVRHDLKNHFSVLSGLLNKGDVNECKEYIGSLYNTVESMGDLIKSDNAVIDYLVNSKLSNLENVKTLVTGYIGNYDDVEDADLACILGNILDNAVEAQENLTGEKRIELHFLTKNTNRIIICKNTVSDSVLANNKALKSTKKDPEYHGLGHHIIESTAEKYHGWVDYFEDDGMFGVQVMLPIQNK